MARNAWAGTCVAGGIVAAAAGIVAASACTGGGGAVSIEPAGGGAQPGGSIGGVGQACDAARPCRAGLACAGGGCAPSHARDDGAPCVISAECKQGDFCAGDRRCAPAGAQAAGGACRSDAECAAGLRCDLVALSAACAPEGAVDVGGACATSGDCFGGLACANGRCAALPVMPAGQPPPLALPAWPGVACEDDPGPTKGYFRVPRGANDGDFYRLPFPNDVRTTRVDGALHPDLRGHPTPGADLLGYDLVDRWLRDVEASADGFSVDPTVTMRFSAPIDFASLSLPGALRWLRLDASGAATTIGFAWTATTGRGAYVCPMSLSARPARGAPLDEGATYAFVVSAPAKDASGAPIAADDDLRALLGAAAPSDPALSGAWRTYAPLRAWAAANGGASAIVDAALFTVGHPSALAPKLVAAAQTAAPPSVDAWTRCDGATPSPCPQAAGDRACGAPDPAFDELHALVTLPIFQRGVAPYASPDRGGDIARGADGAPEVQGTAQVCLALTVPKGAPPADGWPLVIYAHDTGGSFRSHVSEGVAALLAAAKADDGAAVPIAVLGIDQVEHGTRRGASSDAPAALFAALGNPQAARGNRLQGAADQASLLRLVASLSIPPSVTGAAVRFSRIAFWGHGQGAIEGAIATPYLAGLGAVVLSGASASVADALSTTRAPLNVADVAPIALEDAAFGAVHPVLAVMQNALDPADPLVHAAGLVARPSPDVGAKHVFQPFGERDTFTSPATQATFALAARLGVAAAPASNPAPTAIGDAPPLAVPASGNVKDGAAPITAIVRAYAPGAYDGHFVAFQAIDARGDASTFLADALSGRLPKVGR